MNDINAAIQKIVEGINELFAAIAEAAAELAKQANNNFIEFAEVINEALEKAKQQQQQQQKEPMRAKRRPDYKQHIRAATKPPYIKQDRKSTGKRGI